jgi:hypothetical protein
MKNKQKEWHHATKPLKKKTIPVGIPSWHISLYIYIFLLGYEGQKLRDDGQSIFIKCPLL